MADKKYELTFHLSDGSNQKVLFTVPAGTDGKTAYEYAVEGGYWGSEEEFAEKLAQDTPTSGDTPVQSDAQIIKMLAVNDILPTIHDGSSKILIGANNTIMLRY